MFVFNLYKINNLPLQCLAVWKFVMKSNDKDLNDWLSKEITYYFDIFLVFVSQLAYSVTRQTSNLLIRVRILHLAQFHFFIFQKTRY